MMAGSERMTALVTGANRGIGFEIARQLAAMEIFVLMGARDEAKGREAAERLTAGNLKASFIQLDMADPESIRGAVEQIENRHGRLNILVNNAGIAPDKGRSVLDVPLDVLEAAFRTNALGPLLLGRAVVPLMRSNRYGRIVNVSSSMGSLAAMAGASSEEAAMRVPSYRLSKTALNAVTTLLAMELRDDPILVNSACPGWVRTDMGGEKAPLSPEQGADTPVWLATLPDDGPSGGFFRERKAIDW
jgi:NAD(P)-dependent dehydrogenase (short-subunit alcohol dehydrogenase family)